MPSLWKLLWKPTEDASQKSCWNQNSCGIRLSDYAPLIIVSLSHDRPPLTAYHTGNIAKNMFNLHGIITFKMITWLGSYHAPLLISVETPFCNFTHLYRLHSLELFIRHSTRYHLIVRLTSATPGDSSDLLWASHSWSYSPFRRPVFSNHFLW